MEENLQALCHVLENKSPLPEMNAQEPRAAASRECDPKPFQAEEKGPAFFV